MSIQEKLQEIQGKLRAPKSQFNKFGGYSYRSCEDILEAVKPLLGKAVLKISDEMIQLGDRYYVKATVKLTLGEEVEVATAYAREAENKKGMDESQITGAASSYARKYALNGLFLIDDTKDADSMDNTAKPIVKKVTEEKIKQLEDMIKETGTKEKELLGYFKVKGIKSLTYKQYKEAIQLLAKKKEKGK